MRIAVFGLGYVGCVTAACLAKMGHDVRGVDVSPLKVRMLNQGRAPVGTKGIEALVAEVVRSGRRDRTRKGKLTATTDPARALGGAELSLVCVGTPSKGGGAPDLGYVLRAVRDIAGCLGAAQRHTVAIRSTIPPGTMENLVIPELERGAGRLGRGRGVCFFPEFLREGSSIRDFFDPPKIVIGARDAQSAQLLVRLFRSLRSPLFVTSFRVAEMVKYADNAFHALKVCFANEIGALCRGFGIDGHQVMDIFVQDRKLNISPLYLKPGFAFGGPCLPKDVRALNSMAREHGVETPLMSSILESNSTHLRRAVELVLAAGKERIGVLGLAFKSDTDDLRESPACALVKGLVHAGRKVKVYDPRVQIDRLVGANRTYVESEVPGLAHLLAGSARELLASSQAVVITGRQKEFLAALRNLKKRQVLIDLVPLAPAELSPRTRRIGLC